MKKQQLELEAAVAAAAAPEAAAALAYSTPSIHGASTAAAVHGAASDMEMQMPLGGSPLAAMAAGPSRATPPGSPLLPPAAVETIRGSSMTRRMRRGSKEAVAAASMAVEGGGLGGGAGAGLRLGADRQGLVGLEGVRGEQGEMWGPGEFMGGSEHMGKEWWKEEV